MRRSLAQLFAARVREEASARRLSINMLADFAGISRGFLSELLRGEKVASLDTVEKIASALDLDAWQLLVARPEIARAAEDAPLPYSSSRRQAPARPGPAKPRAKR